MLITIARQLVGDLELADVAPLMVEAELVVGPVVEDKLEEQLCLEDKLVQLPQSLSMIQRHLHTLF